LGEKKEKKKEVAAALRHAQWLERLDLSHNGMGNSGAIDLLAYLPVLLSLRKPEITYSELDESVVQAL
jgi:hypothetical protein